MWESLMDCTWTVPLRELWPAPLWHSLNHCEKCSSINLIEINRNYIICSAVDSKGTLTFDYNIVTLPFFMQLRTFLWTWVTHVGGCFFVQIQTWGHGCSESCAAMQYRFDVVEDPNMLIGWENNGIPIAVMIIIHDSPEQELHAKW